jgi:hypothetical protein
LNKKKVNKEIQNIVVINRALKRLIPTILKRGNKNTENKGVFKKLSQSNR